jgi:hypothetical protein
MYANPVHIRSERFNLSLTPAERRLVEAVAELNGTQPSVLMRELAIEGLKLLHVSKSAVVNEEKRHAHA